MDSHPLHSIVNVQPSMHDLQMVYRPCGFGEILGARSSICSSLDDSVTGKRFYWIDNDIGLHLYRCLNV